MSHTSCPAGMLLSRLSRFSQFGEESRCIPRKRETRRETQEEESEDKGSECMIYKRGQHWHLDITVNGVRYREALKTTDRREASALEKKRVGEIQAGKAASKSGREYARKPFGEAADQFLEERRSHVAERTMQFERERLKALRKFFGERPLLRITARDIAAFQKSRLEDGVKGRTINMEVSVLRRMLKRAKVWNTLR
jgi:tetrahydromethanopterin S-methyltransferase subunit F